MFKRGKKRKRERETGGKNKGKRCTERNEKIMDGGSKRQMGSYGEDNKSFLNFFAGSEQFLIFKDTVKRNRSG